MKVVTAYPDGIFSWIDLASTDFAAAKAFYHGLFGWDALEIPMSEDYSYYMFQIQGHDVAGGSQMMEGMMPPGTPSHWTSYVNHSDIDSVVAKVADAGGTVIAPPMDVMESGRLAMIQDPTGAMVGIWQPNQHIGAKLVNQPNTLIWNELQTRDVAAAKAFYEKVFGWENQTDDNGYVVFKADGRIQAGMMQIDDSWGPVPPNWAVYFMTEDVAATAAKAQELGGNVLVPIMQAGEMGHFAVIQDPSGAVFTAMQFNGPVDPPPGH
ncbi:MAG: VOC family protein [Anaerolineales bacterium]|nr:VOC family protein [Anaerolineales bacterium]